mmetsp:Transcript_15342/g.33169  ORF Transcript_15342/g.33169 Transcript_15342/m.33169 type:complete len:113 (-) Transcript_15342:19-357(-)
MQHLSAMLVILIAALATVVKVKRAYRKEFVKISPKLPPENPPRHGNLKISITGRGHSSDGMPTITARSYYPLITPQSSSDWPAGVIQPHPSGPVLKMHIYSEDWKRESTVAL